MYGQWIVWEADLDEIAIEIALLLFCAEFRLRRIVVHVLLDEVPFRRFGTEQAMPNVAQVFWHVALLTYDGRKGPPPNN
jgi:hypothetical protein